MVVIDIGPKIQEVFESRNLKLTDFADELGTVRQNVYRIFKKRHLDTGLLLKISKVLHHNFFQYYVDNSTENMLEAEKLVQLTTEAEEGQRKLELAYKEIDYLKKIISLMEEKAELVQQMGKDALVIQ